MATQLIIVPALPAQQQQLSKILESDNTQAITSYVFTANKSLRKIKELEKEKDRIEVYLSSARRKYKKAKAENAPAKELELLVKRGVELKQQYEAITLVRLRDIADPIDTVKIFLVYLQENINVGGGLTLEQYDTIAHAVLEQYGLLYPEELALVMKNALRGVYGNVFNRLDTITVLKWIELYITDRDEQAYAERENNRLSQKQSRGDETTLGALTKIKITS